MSARIRAKKKSTIWKKLLVIAGILLFLAAGLLIAYMMNHITKVEVEGNSFYTEEEIRNLVISGELEQNAWYLYWKYKYSEPPDIAFVDKTEVELTGRGSVKIIIYEKRITGCVEYLGSYMYFDKDGTVVESSGVKMPDIPLIIGLKYDRIALYEKIQVSKDEVFQYILNLTKELKKNEIMPDKISFDHTMQAVLYFGQTKVMLGTEENQNEKITRLKALIGELEGKSGTLHMEEVDEDNKNIIFQGNEQ